MSVMGRIFAAMYDRMMSQTEEAGLREQRRAIVGRAEGRVLEIGAGTGLNLDHYGAAVSKLVLTEPEEPMARRLRERLGEREAEVVAAPADALPFPDDAFDSVVSTLVLCTVPDQARALAEISRVLRPGGRLLLIEHVRAEDPGLARWQDRVLPVWRFVGHGCHPNRDTASALRAAGFEVDVRGWRIPKAAPIIRPAIEGVATPPA